MSDNERNEVYRKAFDKARTDMPVPEGRANDAGVFMTYLMAWQAFAAGAAFGFDQAKAEDAVDEFAELLKGLSEYDPEVGQ